MGRLENTSIASGLGGFAGMVKVVGDSVGRWENLFHLRPGLPLRLGMPPGRTIFVPPILDSAAPWIGRGALSIVTRGDRISAIFQTGALIYDDVLSIAKRGALFGTILQAGVSVIGNTMDVYHGKKSLGEAVLDGSLEIGISGISSAGGAILGAAMAGLLPVGGLLAGLALSIGTGIVISNALANALA